MDRQFDYAQKILLAVEFADAPRRIEHQPATYTLFRRLSMPELARAPQTDSAFKNVLTAHMNYWESRVPAGQHCFVHYAIGTDAIISAAFDRLKADGGFVLLGVYHVEPQGSAYPGSFPFGHAPDHWHLGEQFALTNESIFWFNFFPAQPYQLEKFFATWLLFLMQQQKARAETNQLVVSDGRDRVIAQGVADIVQVNLVRFTSLAGFIGSAHAAGQQTFTPDPDYLWYGMLLSAVEAP